MYTIINVNNGSIAFQTDDYREAQEYVNANPGFWFYWVLF